MSNAYTVGSSGSNNANRDSDSPSLSEAELVMKQVEAENIAASLSQWLRVHIRGMQAIVENLSESAFHYLRIRWGPNGEPKEGEHKSSTIKLRESDEGERRDGHNETHSEWWFLAREGPPSSSRVNRTRQMRREMPKRLRNPRSSLTRNLCLLNRLRVHLSSTTQSLAENEETTIDASVNDVPKQASSYELKSQRWARTLPRGPNLRYARLKSVRSAARRPQRREVHVW